MKLRYSSRSIVLVLILTCSAIVTAQTKKNGQRPVFLSGLELAPSCTLWRNIVSQKDPSNPDKLHSTNATEMIGAARCTGYILGWLDGELDPVFSVPYSARASDMSEMSTFVDVFLKYEGDHPELQNYAATTLLHRAQQIIADAEKPRPVPKD